MSLKGRRVLITAGPTWVPIDSVRVISNIATGETGILLARGLERLGAKVTLLLGPVGECSLNSRIRLIRFRFFDELKKAMLKELARGKYEAVIHSAAVADYRPQASFKQKVKSGIKRWKLNLVPTPKIIDSVKKIDKSLFLAGFKFEPEASREALIKSARRLMDRSGLDLAVANTINRGRYIAYIIREGKIMGPISSKNNLAGELIREVSLNTGG